VDEGGLVAFPTETVYGIACRAEGRCLERLDQIKGRGADKRLYPPHRPEGPRQSIRTPYELEGQKTGGTGLAWAPDRGV